MHKLNENVENMAKQNCSYKVKPWLSTQPFWSSDLILRSGSMQMVWVQPTAWICISEYQQIWSLCVLAILSSRSKRHSRGSAPTLGSCTDSLAPKPDTRWLLWAALQCSLTSRWGLPSPGNATRIKAQALLGSFCTAGSKYASNVLENGCDRRSLSPGRAGSPAERGPQSCGGLVAQY